MNNNELKLIHIDSSSCLHQFISIRLEISLWPISVQSVNFNPNESKDLLISFRAYIGPCEPAWSFWGQIGSRQKGVVWASNSMFIPIRTTDINRFPYIKLSAILNSNDSAHIWYKISFCVVHWVGRRQLVYIIVLYLSDSGMLSLIDND